MGRLDISRILADPAQRRRMMVGAIIALQAREGRQLDWKYVEQVYDKVRYNKHDNVVHREGEV